MSAFFKKIVALVHDEESQKENINLATCLIMGNNPRDKVEMEYNPCAHRLT
jgi:hypothetical protein